MDRLIKKAMQSECSFKVSAMALDSRGNVLGYAKNRPFMSRKGGGMHAEEEIITKYGNRIHTIVICRVGNSGDLLPIHPCSACKENADRRGIKIITIGEL